MESGNFSDYRVHLWLAQLGKTWVALHFADPNVSGAYASEVFGGSYSRMKTTWSTPDSRVMFNEVSVYFKGLPSVKISFIAGWDKQYNGNLEFCIPLTDPVPVLAGRGYTIDANMLALSLP